MLGLLFAASPPVSAIENLEMTKKTITIVLIGADEITESRITAALTKAHLPVDTSIIAGVETEDICADIAPALENGNYRELIAALGRENLIKTDAPPNFNENFTSYIKPPNVKAFHGIFKNTYARAGV